MARVQIRRRSVKEKDKEDIVPLFCALAMGRAVRSTWRGSGNEDRLMTMKRPDFSRLAANRALRRTRVKRSRRWKFVCVSLILAAIVGAMAVPVVIRAMDPASYSSGSILRQSQE